jgi:hypothetical protein
MRTDTRRKVFEMACGAQLHEKLRCKHQVVRRQIEISVRHRLIVIIVTESIFFNEYNKSFYYLHHRQKKLRRRRKLVPSESRFFRLQEDAHAAGTRKFYEADSSVNC